MYISDILTFNKDDYEADVYASDGTFSILCYAYPVDNVFLGQDIPAVFSYGCKDIIREVESTFRIKKLPQYYAYSVTAQVLSQQEGSVQIGKICIQLDTTMPADISDGDFVSFSVVRFDFSPQ
jgi:hypothetical protein